MELSGVTTVSGVCSIIGNSIEKFPICVETGTMFGVSPDNLVHTTTNNIINFICRPNKGKLFSLDIDKSHQDISRHCCYGNDCEYILGDSVESLINLSVDFERRGTLVDVLWLDSKEFDEDHAVNEYYSIEKSLRPNKHYVMVDDIHNPNSVKYKNIVPILKSLGYYWVEVCTPTGLFVATKGYF